MTNLAVVTKHERYKPIQTWQSKDRKDYIEKYAYNLQVVSRTPDKVPAIRPKIRILNPKRDECIDCGQEVTRSRWIQDEDGNYSLPIRHYVVWDWDNQEARRQCAKCHDDFIKLRK